VPATERPPIDFAFLRQRITLEQVLRHLGLFDDLRGRAPQLRGRCPFHEGDRRRRTLSVHLGKKQTAKRGRNPNPEPANGLPHRSVEEAELSHIAEPLRRLAIPCSSIHLDPNNARLHSDKNIDAIMKSLAEFGQDQPVVVQKQGMIARKGNGRLLAAKRLGWKWIAALVVDEDDVAAAARAIADNRAAELATWDEAKLAQLLQSIGPKPQALIAARLCRRGGALDGRRRSWLNRPVNRGGASMKPCAPSRQAE
jgi:hypothetical protein